MDVCWFVYASISRYLFMNEIRVKASRKNRVKQFKNNRGKRGKRNHKSKKENKIREEKQRWTIKGVPHTVGFPSQNEIVSTIKLNSQVSQRFVSWNIYLKIVLEVPLHSWGSSTCGGKRGQLRHRLLQLSLCWVMTSRIRKHGASRNLNYWTKPPQT